MFKQVSVASWPVIHLQVQDLSLAFSSKGWTIKFSLLSLYIMYSSLLTIMAALPWTHSSTSIPKLYRKDRNWAEYSLRNLTNAEGSWRIEHINRSPSLTSSANLLRMQPILFPRSLIKIWKIAGPSTDHWRVPLVTGCQLDFVIIFTQEFGQFSTCFKVHLVSHQFSCTYTVGDCVEYFAKVKIHSIYCSHSLNWPPWKGVRLFRNNLAFVNPLCLFPVTFLSFICLQIASRRSLPHNLPGT